MITELFTLALLAYPLLTVVIAVVVLRRRNRTEPDERAPGIIYLVQIVGASAAGWATLLAVSQSVIVFQPQTAIDAVTEVEPFTPWSIPSFPLLEDATGAYVIFADVHQVRVAVPNGDLGSQLLQVLGGVTLQLPTVAVGVFVAILCGRIIRKAPFAAELARLSTIGAGVFLVAGFAGQVVTDLASYRLAATAFDLVRAENPSASLPTPIWPSPVDLWPLWGALALAVLAVLIRHGARLQRDTEGLV